MKNTVNSAIIIAIVTFFAFSSTAFCSKPEDKNNGKEISVKTEQKEAKEVKTEPVIVKNIWKDMPSFDKFGNEITGKARKNMMENSSKKIKTNESSNVTVVNEISEVK
jgi:hypothetical protein